jgi:hypothetical protein
MFDKAMKKSIEPYLQPGEELVNVMIVQGNGMTKALAGGGAIGAAALGAMRDRKAKSEPSGGRAIELSSKMGLAITTTRLLVFKAGGAVTLSAKEMLSGVPLGEVDSVEVGKGMMSKPITLTVNGEAFQVEAPKAANTKEFVATFEQAKAAGAARV